ncbi:MAG: hypothetical protein ACTHU0_19220 [Kofleriaceae bacterium]
MINLPSFVERISVRLPIPVILHADIDPLFDGWRLRVSIKVPDIHTGEPTWVHTMAPVERIDTEGRAVSRVRSAILKALEHELDECLLLDGKQVRDPHANERFAVPREAEVAQ